MLQIMLAAEATHHEADPELDLEVVVFLPVVILSWAWSNMGAIPFTPMTQPLPLRSAAENDENEAVVVEVGLRTLLLVLSPVELLQLVSTSTKRGRKEEKLSVSEDVCYLPPEFTYNANCCARL
jgi:hypothetical protein